MRIKCTFQGISGQEFSERSGIDRDTLNAFEARTERVSANLLLRITKLLEARPDYFFPGYTEEEFEACLVHEFK